MSNPLCRCQKCTGKPPPENYSAAYLRKCLDDAILRMAKQIAALYTLKERRAALEKLRKDRALKIADEVEAKLKELWEQRNAL